MKKNALQKYWPLYLLTIVIAFVLRYFSKITDSDVITWMLMPTARWAGILSGISFEYLPHRGYVNHFYRFLIAPSCAGIRFMMIVFLMLSFSFLYRIEKRKLGYLWFFLSFAFSYIATIFVNGIRIIASICLPLLLEKPGMANSWLTPDRLHTLIGTGVYFFSLYILYLLAASVCKRWFSASDAENALMPSSSVSSPASSDNTTPSHRLFTPVFWYLLTVLVLPFFKRILTNDWKDFGQYALLVFCTCLVISALLCIAGRLRRRPS